MVVSKKLQFAIRLTKMLAAKYGHELAGSHHLLVPLCNVKSDPLLAQALATFGFNMATVFKLFAVIDPPTGGRCPESDVSFSDEAVYVFSKAMDFCVRDAKQLVEPIHLFEALLTVPGTHTKIIEAFVPVDVLYENLFDREIEKPANEVTIEEIL